MALNMGREARQGRHPGAHGDEGSTQPTLSRGAQSTDL